MTLFLLLLKISTAEVPVPEVLWQNDHSRLWLVEQRRSDWVVIEECRTTPADATFLGALLREALIPVAEEGLRRGVELRLAVAQNSLCMSWAGPREHVQTALDEGIGWPSAWKLTHEHRDSVLLGLRNQRAAAQSSLRALHQAAEWRLLSGLMERPQKVPPLKQLRRSYRRVCSERKVSVVGAMGRSDQQWLQRHFDSSCWRRASKHEQPTAVAFARNKVTVFPIATPNQAAFSLLIDVSAHNWAERQLIASALDGLDGRLSTRLREELGLVYAIGAKVAGRWIVINTTTSTENVALVETAVFSVLRELSSTPIDAREQKRILLAAQRQRMARLEDPHQIARVLNLYQEANGWRESVIYKEQTYLAPLKSIRLQPVFLLWTGDVALKELCYTLEECGVISSDDFTHEQD